MYVAVDLYFSKNPHICNFILNIRNRFKDTIKASGNNMRFGTEYIVPKQKTTLRALENVLNSLNSFSSIKHLSSLQK